MSRNKNVVFVLNTGPGGGSTVVEDMAADAVIKAATQIRDRANRISESIREHPQVFRVVETGIGIPNRKGGTRFYAKIQGTVRAYGKQRELDQKALKLSLEAARMGNKSFDTFMAVLGEE